MDNGPIIGRRQRALMALARFVCRRAAWIVPVAVLLAAVSVVYTVANIGFITDRTALIDPDTDFNRRFIEFSRAFGDQETMLVMVGAAPGPQANPQYHPDAPDAELRARMKHAASRVAAELRTRPDLFPSILERVPPESFSGTRMLYLPLDDLHALEQQLSAAAPMLRHAATDPSWPGLLAGLRENLQSAPPAEADTAEMQAGGEGMARLLASIRQALEAQPGTPGPTELFEFRSTDPNLDEDGYLFAWDGRILFMPVLPRKDSEALNQVKEPLSIARESVARIAPEYPDLAIGLSGRPVIYADEMEGSSRDMALATILAVCGVGLLFVFAFRSVARPLLAVAALVLALCWTFGATTLVIGHLNIFAMVFSVVLVGLGIDFGIHMLSHYRDALAHGFTVRDALIEVYGEVGMGTVLGALTTAAALSTAALTDFIGLAELGLICGMGIVLCLLAMLVVFPALLVLVDARRVGEGDPALQQARRDADAAPARSVPRRGAWAVAALLAVCVIAAGVQAARGWVPFDYNLLELNDPSSPGVDWEKLLIRHDQRTSFAVSVRPSLREIAELRAQLEPLVDQGLVRGFESLAPQQEAEKRDTLARLRRSLPANFAVAPPEASTAARLRAVARGLQAALNQLAARGPSFEAAFAPALAELRGIQDLLRDRAQHAELRMRQTEPAFFGDLRAALAQLRTDSDPPPVTASGLPPALRARYVGRGPAGRELHALYIYPARDAWDHANAGEFNAAVAAVDPQATGVTMQIYHSANLIVRGFALSVIYAFAAIVILLFLDLRRPLAVLVALMPLLGSLAVLGGVMMVSGLRFNFANFFAVPIIIGVNVDAGVYLVHSQRHGDPRRTVAATRRACVLCGLTTLLGFGSLMIASHRGVVSLGMVLAVGCVAGILVSYFLVPGVLGWFNERGRRL